jgi:hypothetical protein
MELQHQDTKELLADVQRYLAAGRLTVFEGELAKALVAVIDQRRMMVNLLKQMVEAKSVHDRLNANEAALNVIKLFDGA